MVLKTMWNKYYATIIFTVGCLAMGLVVLLLNISNNGTDYTKIAVANGESVWQIAENYAEQTNMDKVAFVKWVEQENNLIDGQVREGEDLVIPVRSNIQQNKSTIQLANK
ncbi:cell division suppressor protein YneA [Listeria sp. PSOL-1]|uniref:cell division suppressor protein YneA n=1 Tax=Listeria sp. PSOL-1 TaxID=1844999 RepID=UPI0013CFC49F|nr:cell division suppressor protein YneA [Listeria sp. PSOL-1]